jgi:hypothetical protein
MVRGASCRSTSTCPNEIFKHPTTVTKRGRPVWVNNDEDDGRDVGARSPPDRYLVDETIRADPLLFFGLTCRYRYGCGLLNQRGVVM